MSQSNIQGEVQQVSTKEWFDSKNNKTINLYSFKLNNTWYRLGTDSPRFNQGANISFTATERNGNLVVRSSEITSSTGGQSQGGQQPSSAPTAPAPAGGQSRDGYWAAKEANDKKKDERYQNNDIPRMSFSAAQDRAVHLVSAALAEDALSFGNAAKGKKLDMLLEFVDQITDRFVVQTVNSPEHITNLQRGDNAPVASSKEGDSEEYNYGA